MELLACPKCHLPLHLDNRTFKCTNNHCYDLSKRGYINLLLNPDKASNNPGDSKESLIARKAFLNQGYYDVILQQVTDMIDKYKTTKFNGRQIDNTNNLYSISKPHLFTVYIRG